MNDEERSPTEEPEREPPPPPKSGDTIIAEVGDDARNVVVGKNVIQIGTLKIPLWLAYVIAAGAMIAAVVVVFTLASTRRVEQAVTAPTDTPTPTPTPTATSTPTPTPTPTPAVMSDGEFNIAVAEFEALDQQGQPADNENAREFARTIAGFFASQKNELAGIVGQPVTVWGPDMGVPPVAEDEAPQRAEAINADVLIYGALRQISDSRWRIQPKFYLNDPAVQRATELGGEHALGAAIDYRPDNSASIREANMTLRMRLEALAQMLIGLSYFTWGDAEGYQKATETFQQIVDDSAWANAEDKSGQEILYLFLGSSYLQEAGALTGEERLTKGRQLLDKARDAFERGLTYNDRYARLLNGQAALLFAEARWDTPGSIDCAQTDFDKIEQAEALFKQALAMPEAEKLSPLDVDMVANAGLGRIYLTYAVCGDPDYLQQAKERYQAVIDLYSQRPLRHLTWNALFAHAELAGMLFSSWVQAGQPSPSPLLDEIIPHYRSAVELALALDTETSHAYAQQRFMPLLLFALCQNGQAEEIPAELEQFSLHYPDPEQIRIQVLSAIELPEECQNVQTP